MAGTSGEPLNFDRTRERIRDFLNQFHEEDDNGQKIFPYREQIARLAERQQLVVYINLDNVQETDSELADEIRANTRRFQNLFREVVDELIQEQLGDRQPPVLDSLDAFIYQRVYMDAAAKQKEGSAAVTAAVADLRKKYPPQLLQRFDIFFKSADEEKPLSVRQCDAQHIGKLVTLKGVVIRATEVKPMVSVVTYTCDTCAAETYQPVVGSSYMPTFNCPSRDCVESRANGRLQPQIRGSKFVKYQEVKIQEMSDQVPVGSIPRMLTLHIYGENTRHCAPGDVIRVSGVLLPMLRSGFKQMTGGLMADTFLEVHHVENFNKGEDGELNENDELTAEEIEIVSSENFYEQLATSIAPEIYGHTDVKKSLLLAMVGGVDRNASGMRIRGAINVLLMGDPGVAKSQLLSYVDRLAPRSQYTTGRGSSGVGLTASVVKDNLTGEMTLEGGALVLADKGVCCIDEFDKMIEADRTAIHEVMEQQTVSIAKAGILTTLNARVSIVAAANPAFGRYNPKRKIEANLDLPAALLSRFDLIWLIQDRIERDSDRKLAEHITHVHRTGSNPPLATGLKPLDMNLVRRYVSMCKRKQPVLELEQRDQLVEMYVSTRRTARHAEENALFTSPRLLLSVIRMATALARLRLADVVHPTDVNEAIRLFQASQHSLVPPVARSHHARLEPVDAVYGVLRELRNNIGPDDDAYIPIDKLIRSCARSALSEEAVQQSLSVYQANGIITVDRQQRIYFAD